MYAGMRARTEARRRSIGRERLAAKCKSNSKGRYFSLTIRTIAHSIFGSRKKVQELTDHSEVSHIQCCTRKAPLERRRLSGALTCPSPMGNSVDAPNGSH